MPPGKGVRPDLATRLRLSQRAVKGRLERPETVLAIMRAAHDTLEPGKIGELVVQRAVEWLRVPSCAVVAPDLDGQITAIAGHGLSPQLATTAAAVGRWVLVNGRGFASSDLRRDARFAGSSGAVVAVPLRCRAQLVAALILLDRRASGKEPKLGNSVGELLTTALEGPAQALDNALTLRRAEALSVTDDLTQLYNSRYLNHVLRREVKRASRSSRPLSLLFLDLDGFKSVNDSHGHLAGSRALVEAAAVIRGSARETDVAARFGGDEFALILPDTGSDGASAVAERIRDRLASHPFLAGDGLSIRLTASVGVATLPDVASTAEELVRAADVAMYRVKDAGKNGIHIASAQAS
ncbi:MAG: sensor domain-containing diguanylate cyclase [Acidobacteria bacterium]|nr:sensor domain-containing diguanylate cyclase [Acidobacteriota bacterium]